MDEFAYYSSQSEYTDPDKYSNLFNNLPNSIAGICEVVHGLVIHKDGTKDLYGFDLPDDRKLESNTRYIAKILKVLVGLENSPLNRIQDPQRRFAGSCRDFAIITCSILRHKGIPARLRCGFAGYFFSDWYSDHWVCEYLDKSEFKWKLVDAELGIEETRRYEIDFDKTDIPRDKFLVAGKAWLDCRSGKLNPDILGVKEIDIKGYWFVRASVLRDLASLNKIELLPWDYTDYFHRPFDDLKQLHEGEISLIDQIAGITSKDKVILDEATNVYNNNPDVQVLRKLTSYTSKGPIDLELGL